MALLGLLTESRTPPMVSGTGTVLGVDMLGEPTEGRRDLRRRHLGAVFQDPTASLNPTMPIGRQLAEVTGSEEKAVELLDAVGVPEPRARLKSFPHELSGGQRQRVMIAMAIAGEPALVIADEPTTALDVTIQAQILQLIRKLCDELDCAFIIVTHDLGVAAQVADRIAVCYAGRVVERLSSRTCWLGPLTPTRRHSCAPGSPLTPSAGSRSRRSRASRPTCARCRRDARSPLAVTSHSTRARPPLLRSFRSPAGRDRPLASGSARSATSSPLRVSRSPRPPGARIARRSRRWTRSFTPRGRESYKLRGAGRGVRLPALRGIDLDVAPNECVALVGESGCGKSTLLRIVAGLIKPDSGTAQLSGDGTRQMVFQDAGSSLTPWMSVGDQITEGMRAMGVPAREVKERMRLALKRVGLSPELAAKRPRQLSGGQQQRTAIARAIAVPPRSCSATSRRAHWTSRSQQRC